MPQTDQDAIARCFKGLSHPRRVRIFQLLAKAGGRRMTYQELQAIVGIADSSLVHHLREMERLGLIRRRRRGVFAQYWMTPDLFLKHVAEACKMVDNRVTMNALPPDPAQ